MVDPPYKDVASKVWGSPRKLRGSPRKLGGPDPPTPPVVAPLLLNDADNKLIKSVKMPTHCLHELLPLVCLLDFGTLTILRNCLYAFMLARPYSKVCIVFYFSCFFHLMMTSVRHFIKRQTAYLLT